MALFLWSRKNLQNQIDSIIIAEYNLAEIRALKWHRNKIEWKKDDVIKTLKIKGVNKAILS